MNSLGLAFEKNNKMEESMKCYQKAIELNSKNAVAYNNLGNIFNLKNKIPEAV